MFLSGGWIEQNGQGLVSPFHTKQIDCAAYTMRVGGEAYISPEGRGDRKPGLLQLAYEAPIAIPPGQFAFLVTREFIRLPHDLIAFINMKNGLKVSGLVNVSGFHVDPGYRGNLVFAVFNAGPQTVTVRHNQDAFLIWFARLEDATEAFARSKPGFTKIDNDLMARIPAESASLNSLSNRIDQLERRLAVRRTILTYLAGFGSAAVAGVVAGRILEFW